MNDQDQGKRSVPSAADAPDLGQLEKIRDILYGQQARSNDKRFATLERSLQESAATLRTDLVARLDAIEAKMVAGLADLRKSVRAEAKARDAAISHTTNQLDSRAVELDTKIGALTSDLADASSSLTTSLDSRSQEIAELVASHRAELHKSLDATASELRDTKASRSALASLFKDFAKRLEDNA